MEQCLTNAISTLRAKGCESRDYYAGKCEGIAEALGVIEKLVNS